MDCIRGNPPHFLYPEAEMMFRYSINPDSEIPIYRQLVDQINAQIRSGALKTGTQMPTVREMAERLHLSVGTVKRVYDVLSEMGDIEMTRRRGTFVKYVREDKDSRKLRAMTAIDLMIRNLTELNFSPAEIQIFLNLKMREWGLKWSGIRIAMVTDYTELSAALERQLGQIPNVRVTLYSLRQLREYPYSVDEQNDVILASVEDAQRLLSILPDSSKLIRMAFSAGTAGVLSIAQASGASGVLCESGAFADLVKKHLPGRKLRVCPAEEANFEGLDTLVIAEGYENTCGEDVKEAIAAFREKGTVLEFSYLMDAGSMLYLEERIGRIRDERQLMPGALRF